MQILSSRALAICVGAGLLWGQPTATHARAPATVSDPVAEAQRLFADGQAKYDTLDYEGAIDLWMRSYVSFPSTPEFAATRATVLYAVAQARLDLYEIDDNPQHLRHAQRILVAYRAKLDATDVEGKAAIQVWVDRVDGKLGEIDATASPSPEEAPAQQPAQPATPTAVGASVNAASNPAASTPSAAAPDHGLQRPHARRLLISGGALAGIGVGIAAGAGTAFGIAARNKSDEVDEVVNAGNPNDLTLAEAQALDNRGWALGTGQITSVAAGGALVVAGGVLLGLGLARRNDSTGQAAVRPILTPVVTRGYTGLLMETRF